MYKKIIWFNRNKAEQLPSTVLRRYVTTYRYSYMMSDRTYRYNTPLSPPIVRRLAERPYRQHYLSRRSKTIRYIRRIRQAVPDEYQYSTVYVPGVVMIVYANDYPDPETHANGTTRDVSLYDYLAYDMV